MSTSNSVDIVHAFWDQVWNAHDAVWAVREDGRLLTNWVERASWEVYQLLTTA
jgi:hypothetical protein